MTAPEPVLELDELRLSFGGLAAVVDFSAQIKAGEVVGLIGPNGAGKTTVFNLVSGFYAPDSGAVRFLGREIGGMKPQRINRLGLARTFQNIRLWNDLSVFDNLRLALHGRLEHGFFGVLFRSRRMRGDEARIRTAVEETLRGFGLGGVARKSPDSLPYGLRRRVEIARAMIAGPKLLLLDEPAAGLSGAELDDLIALVRWINREFGTAVWMIEHQMPVVMGLCSRLQVLEFGREIAAGTPEAIRADPRVVAAYLGDEAASLGGEAASLGGEAASLGGEAASLGEDAAKQGGEGA